MEVLLIVPVAFVLGAWVYSKVVMARLRYREAVRNALEMEREYTRLINTRYYMNGVNDAFKLMIAEIESASPSRAIEDTQNDDMPLPEPYQKWWEEFNERRKG